MSDRTRPTQELPALRGVEHEDGLMSLAGGALGYNGQWFFVVNGRVTHFNEETQEARGKLSIFAPSKPSLREGPIRMRIHGLEFEITMMHSAEAKVPGEVALRFLARLKPSVSAITRL